MSRAGTRLTLQHANQLLVKGQDWQSGGVLELALAETGLADVEAEVLSQSVPERDPTGWARRAQWEGVPGLWHPHAAWIKPACLVQQWLSHPRIRFHGATTAHTLRRVEPQWLLQDAQGEHIASADIVVFANAHACAELVQSITLPPGVEWLPEALPKLQALQTLAGTLSMGPCPKPAALAPVAADSPRFPPFPVNGHGSFVSGVPTAHGLQWYAGSTFQTDPALHADLAQEHAINRGKLQALLPRVADALAPQFANQQVQAWQGTRCVSHDRLPLVGPLDAGPAPTLWLSAAMGARGLSFSALCAELLAAALGGEPLPVESALAKALDTRRPARKKRQPTAADTASL
jgi:tRNA 5-methylaminomethyl-2-thiouridine biosynthesis bifunctional protein